MKKKFIYASLLFLIVSISNVYSQEWDAPIYTEGTLYPGYIIKTDGTKTEGYLGAQSRASIEGISSSNQNRVEFYTDPENRKSRTIYKPEDLKEYKIAEKTYRSINYSGGLLAKPIRFVLLVTDGAICEYVWYNQIGYEGVHRTPTYEDKVVLKKGDEKAIEMTDMVLGFAKKMSALVSDYPELAAKVANKEKGYNLLAIRSIIKEYNDWYANKK